MAVKIGSRYEETKNILKERIRTGDIQTLEAEAVNHKCYFCGKHIDGKMVVLIDSYLINKNEIQAEYFIDETCYQNAIHPADYGAFSSLN